MDLTYQKDFQYSHNNPYHHRLSEYERFVLRDLEGEAHQGKWNSEIFQNEDPINLEIGCGFGHFMAHYCSQHPNQNYIGMDYRFKRSFELARRLNKTLCSEHFRLLRARGERIQHLFAKNEIDRIFYFFPDPWPKRKQQKRRLFNLTFLENAHKVLRPGGEFLIKTDHLGLGEAMIELVSKTNLFEVEFTTLDLYQDHPHHFLSQFSTKFEKIFLGQGIPIKALALKKPH